MLVGENISENVVSISMLPSNSATNYRSMYALGNHLRVANAEKHLSTVDSRVVMKFEQKCHFHSNDPNPIMVSIEYVGWIKKILKLNYGRFQTILLLCNWVVANYERFVAMVRLDEYGFTLVNFEQLIPI